MPGAWCRRAGGPSCPVPSRAPLRWCPSRGSAAGSGADARGVERLAGAALDPGDPELDEALAQLDEEAEEPELMRLKSLTAGARLDPDDAVDGRRPLEHAFRTWDTAAPLTDWLASHVGPPEELRRRP